MRKLLILLTLVGFSAVAANDSSSTTSTTTTTPDYSYKGAPSDDASTSTESESESSTTGATTVAPTTSTATSPSSASATTPSSASATTPSKTDTTASAQSQVPSKPTKEMAEKMVSTWPSEASKAAKAMISKHGAPTEATESMLIWKNNSPWKRTIVMKEGVEHMFPQKHMGTIQQFVDYKVPVDKVDELVQFNGSLVFDRTRGELAARGDSEEMNFLTLNLAKEILDGKKTVQEARAQFAKSAKSITAAANKDLTKGLKFSAGSSAADPDSAYKEESASSKTGTTTTTSDISSPDQSESSTTGGTTTTEDSSSPSTSEVDPATGEVSDKATDSESTTEE